MNTRSDSLAIQGLRAHRTFSIKAVDILFPSLGFLFSREAVLVRYAESATPHICFARLFGE